MLCAQWTKLLPEHILKRHKNVLLQSTTTKFFFITVCLLLCCVKSMWNTFLVVSFFLNTINYKNTLFVPVNWSPQSSIGVTRLHVHKVYTLVRPRKSLRGKIWKRWIMIIDIWWLMRWIPTWSRTWVPRPSSGATCCAWSSPPSWQSPSPCTSARRSGSAPWGSKIGQWDDLKTTPLRKILYVLKC